MVKKNILIVAASGRYVFTHRAHLVSEARAQGHTVVVVAPQAEQYFEPPYDCVLVDRVNTNPFKEFKTIWSFIKLYRRYKPDVVHHVGLKPALLGSIAAFVTRVPCIINAVSGLGAALDSLLVSRLVRLAMRFFWGRSVVLVQNEVDAQFVHGVASKIIQLPGAGVNLQSFTPPVCEPSTPPFVLMLASRLLWSKGIGLFVDAVKQLRAQGLCVEGWLVGGVDAVNPQAISLEQLQAWQSVITWFGERDDVAQLYQQSHLVVLPTSYREGVPKALIEAVACGRPILTTNRPGCNQVVMDGVNGYFVATVDDIVARVVELYNNPALRDQMGRASRYHAEQTFDEKGVLQITMDLYENMGRATGIEPATS